MLRLNTIQAPRGANRATKRLGRGHGSGQGCQAGKGHKGHKARSGGGVRPGFEGGNKPLYMKLPKWSNFSNYSFAENVTTVTLRMLVDKFSEGETVCLSTLIDKGILKGARKRASVKIVSSKILLAKKLNFSSELSISAGARELILGSGGVVA